MSEGSQDIAQQFISGGVIPAQLVGQSSVSKTYVDGLNADLSVDISTVAGAAGAAQGTANTAVGAAATAQSTANTAVSLASIAQTSANTAQATVDTHKASLVAHSAANITYSGPVEGAANTKQAIDLVKQRVDTIVAGAGESNTEILDARQPATGDPFPFLGGRLNNVDAQLADIEVNVDAFGAHSALIPGYTDFDSTVAIQAALNSGKKKITFTAGGLYKASADLLIPSDMEIDGKGATIEFTNNAVASYHLLKVYGKSNITIKNIFLKGNFDTSSFSLGQGHLIAVGGVSSNVIIENVYFEKATGDGIYLTETSRNIKILNCETNLIYRNGLSIIDAQGVDVFDCYFHDTTSTLPGYGIDLEPNNSSEIINDIRIRRCRLNNNAGATDIGLLGMHTIANSANIEISECEFRGTNIIAISATGYANNTHGVFDINHNRCYGKSLLQMRGTSRLIKKVIESNYIEDWSDSSNVVYGNGMQIFRESTDTYEQGQLGNYVIKNNIFKTTVAKNPVVAISIFDNKLFSFENITVKDNVLIDDSASVTTFINYNLPNNLYKNTDIESFKLDKKYEESCFITNGASINVKSINELINSSIRFDALVVAEIKSVDAVGLTVGTLSRNNAGTLTYKEMLRSSATWSAEFLITSGAFKIKNNAGSNRTWSFYAFVEKTDDPSIYFPSFFTGMLNLFVRRVGVPATATSAGVMGDYAVDVGYIYACHATNTWRRVATSTW